MTGKESSNAKQAWLYHLQKPNESHRAALTHTHSPYSVKEADPFLFWVLGAKQGKQWCSKQKTPITVHPCYSQSTNTLSSAVSRLQYVGNNTEDIYVNLVLPSSHSWLQCSAGSRGIKRGSFLQLRPRIPPSAIIISRIFSLGQDQNAKHLHASLT